MIIRTVLGDISPADLGPCDAHEHLFLDTPAQPGEEFLDRDKAVEEAQTLVAAGGRSLVDWTPLGLGRDLDGLAQVARETGLHVVAATGLHRDAHYAEDSPYRAAEPDALADSFVAELGERCGIIKAGASYHHLTPFEERAFEAAAAAHARTGAPVCVHTQHGTMGLALVERLGRLGVPAQSIVSRPHRPQPRRRRARGDGVDRRDAAARRPRPREVLAGLDDHRPDRGPR